MNIGASFDLDIKGSIETHHVPHEREVKIMQSAMNAYCIFTTL
jgi:hypothetical protein